MTLDELKEKVEALEMTQNMMFALLIQKSTNPEYVISEARKIIKVNENEDNSLKPLANSNILSIVEIAEDFLKGNDV